MKKITTVFISIMLALSVISYAQHAEKEPITGGSTAAITVKGLVCEFCVKTLEKVFSKQPEVDHVFINLSEATVVIAFKENMNIDDVKIRDLVKDAGYDVDEIKRP